MDKLYYLASCSTCRKIIGQLPENSLALQDIRKEPLTEIDLDEMRRLAGSYEALFSRKAQLYKSLGLKDKTLGEPEFRNYLLEHYTFLSRPVFIICDKIFIGNSQKNISEATAALQ